ncbi:LysM peptidoglycan-binding domain-containing protein [Streptomyces sp. NPDC004732]|uniref:LysM peptidoglycan-binding domain-containing protein n=1 Tax=Streptomyces sp. NPDC004732 TaxID=3154290 RepID=UPI0033BA1DF4
MAYTASEAIRLARKETGYREKGQNDTKFNRRFGRIGGYPHDGYGYPWCQSFQSIIHKDAGGRPNVEYPYTAACAAATAWFKQRGLWSKNSPKPGDFIMYGANGGTHVDMVTEVELGRVRVIGGNTGGSMNGAYYNGDGVYEKWVARSNSRIHGYGRPKYVAAGADDKTSVLPSIGTDKPNKPIVSGNKFTIKKGMTLLGIAALLGVGIGELLDANPQIKDKNKITEGQQINVPEKKEANKKPKPDEGKKPSEKPPVSKPGTSKPTSPGTPDRKPGSSSVAATTYKVKKGDSLTKIAARHGVSYKALIAANKQIRNPNMIYVNQTVNIPAKHAVQRSAPAPKVETIKPAAKKYIVKRDDTLSGIAVKHGISLKALLDMNEGRFPDPDLIFSGQHVYLSPGAKLVVPDTVNKDRGGTKDPQAGESKVPKPSKPVTPKPVTPPAPQGQAVTLESLLQSKPVGMQRGWDRPLTAAEIQNARVIYQEAIRIFGPTDGPRAAVIGIATAYQESRLQNLGHGDRDSLGLFQQRPSMGWGSAAQVRDPHYASAKFFGVLKGVNWKGMPLYQAAQAVQRSGHPMAFGQWELSAAKLVVQLSGGSGKHAKQYDPSKDAPKPETAAQGWVKPVAAAFGTPFGKPGPMWSSGYHTGLDFPAPQGTKVVAASSGTVVKTGWAGAYGMLVEIRHQDGKVSRYAHLSAISIGQGQTVTAGQQIGNVGSTGNSTGPHLHFEVLEGGKQVDPMRFLR